MKRFLSIILVMTMIFTSVFALSGCENKNKDVLQMGQWIMMVADSFGMVTYVEEKPYFPEVTKDDPSYAAFQMAAEWGILEPSEEISSKTPVTWNDVMVTLVNAGEFVGADATKDDKIAYAMNHFGVAIDKSKGKKEISMEEAIPLLDAAQKMWASMEFTEKIEQISLAEGVKDYLADSDVKYTMEGDTLFAQADVFNDLNPGDVYVLPGNEKNPASINKVKDIQVVDGQVIIENDENFTEEEAGKYIGELVVKDTSPLDFTNDVIGIYDENGNPISYELEESILSSVPENQGVMPIASTMAHTSRDTANIIQTGIFDDVKVPLKFKINDKYEAIITLGGSDISVEVSAETDKISSRYREQKKKEYLKTTFRGFKVTKDIDYSWGVLHSATIKMDYKVVTEGGIKISRGTKIGNPEKEGSEDKDIRKTLNSTLNAYKNALDEFNKDMRNSKCHEDIYICKIRLAGAGNIASVDFIIKGKISADGCLKVVVEAEGAKGIQYRNGNLRYINDNEIDVDFSADAKLEVTVAPGIRVSLLKKITVVEFTADAGLGVSIAMVAHMFDAAGHELYSEEVTISGTDADELVDEELFTTVEEIQAFAKEHGGYWNTKDIGLRVQLKKGVCLKWNLYPILKIGMSNDGIIAKCVKATPSLEILGKDDTFLKGHIDFPNNITSMIESDSFSGGCTAFLGIGAECTYTYTPWDDLLEEETETSTETETDNEDENTSDSIEISEISVVLGINESRVLQIVGIPKGYELKDIEAEIADCSIASFDLKTGTITGVSAGVTQLVIQTKDGHFKAYCAITVNEDNKIEFEELKEVIFL